MLHRINCPTCSKALYYPHLESLLEDAVDIACVYCHCKYQAVYGKVSELNIVEERTNANGIFSVTASTYKFHLITSKSFERVQFSIPRRSQKFLLQNGDKVYIVYIIRKIDSSKKIACIQNTSIEKDCVIFGKRRVWIFRTTACIAPSVIALVIGSILPVNIANFIKISSILIDIATGVFAFKITDFTEPNRKKLSQLSDEQKLLCEQYQLEERIQPLHLECEKYQRMLQQMRFLRQDLYASGEELYSERIEVVSQGIRNLENALNLTQTLIENYTQFMKMLAIEYKTSRLAEKFPVDTTESILRKLDELKKVEAKIEKLTLYDSQDL